MNAMKLRKDYIYDDRALICSDCAVWHANGDLSAMGEDEAARFVEKVSGYSGGRRVNVGWGREQHSCPEGTEECDCETESFTNFQCASCGLDTAGTAYGATVWADGREIEAERLLHMSLAAVYVTWVQGDWYPTCARLEQADPSPGDGFVWISVRADGQYRAYRLGVHESLVLDSER